MHGAMIAFIGLGLLSCPLVPALAQQNRTVAILMPGASGGHPSDFLVRNRSRIGGAGIETRLTASPKQAAEIARSEKQKGRKVVLVGMSLGTVHVAQALAAGAPVDGAVFVSGNLRGAARALGSPERLPPSLVVHHRNDRCVKTPPSGVGFFQQWSVCRASVSWITTAGGPDNRPCQPRGAHGFFMQDGPAVSAIVGFIRSR
jgi:pimeloyl-ACP methyl ester carboxylesterase